MAAKDGGKPRKAAKRRQAIPGLELHHGSYRWRPVVEGKRLTVALVAKTEAGAIAEVMELRKRPLKLESNLWAEAVEHYVRQQVVAKKLAQKTAEMRRPVLLALGRELKLARPESLTPAMAGKWVRLLEKRERMSESTRADYLKYLTGFVRWCLKTQRMRQDPLEDILRPTAQAKLRDVFLPAERVAELLKEARQSGDRDMEYILALGFECGMRRGEIDACREEWFDLRTGVVVIPAVEEVGEWQGRKGREGRRREAVVPLSKVMLEIIGRHGLPRPYVVNPDKEWGDHTYRFEFRGRYRKFMNRHGCQHLTIHDMRRSFASNRVSAGVSLEKVANWMGISREVAWKRYSRFMPADEEINRGSAGGQVSPVVTHAPLEAPAPVKGAVERLGELQALKLAGLITEEEWAAKRGEILKGI